MMRQELLLGRIKEMIFWVIDSSLESSSWGTYREGTLISTFFFYLILSSFFSVQLSFCSFFFY